MSNNELLDQDEAAAFLRLSPLTLKSWRRHRTGPPSGKFGSRVLYRRSDLEAWVEEQFRRAA